MDILGIFAMFIGAAVLVLGTVYHLIRRKPGFTKTYLLGMALALGGLVLFLVGLPKQKHPDLGLSAKAWRTHSETTLGTMLDISKTTSPRRAYELAYKASGYYRTCGYSGCFAMRRFLDLVTNATEDGVVTPKESVEVAEAARYVAGELEEGVRRRVQTKTGKSP